MTTDRHTWLYSYSRRCGRGPWKYLDVPLPRG